MRLDCMPPTAVRSYNGYAAPVTQGYKLTRFAAPDRGEGGLVLPKMAKQRHWTTIAQYCFPGVLGS
jgi:hypothetical protein